MTKILLVEDESIVAMDLKRMLETMNYEVVGVAASGKRAIEIARVAKPDLLLTDIMLGGSINGIDAARAIKEEQDVAVVYMTGNADQKTIEMARSTDPHGYVLKPIERDHLFSTLDAAVHRQGLERKLRKSEERFHLAMEAVNEGLWDYNVESRELYFSSRCFGMLGYLPDELPSTYSTWESLVHPDDRENANAIILACTENRVEAFELELRMKQKDGSWRWVLGRGKSVARNSQGRSLRLIGTQVDIEQRKQTEFILKESEERFRSVVASLAEGIMIFDADGTIVDCNRSGETIIGVQHDRVIGRKLGETEWEDVRADGSALLRDQHPVMHTLRTGDSVFGTVMGLYRPDGARRWLSCNTYPILSTEDGSVIAAASSFTDVTDSRNAEKMLRISEEKFARAFHVSPDVITISDLHDGKYKEVNEGFTAKLGYRREEALGRTSIDLGIWADPEDRTRLTKVLQKKGEVTNFVAEFRSKDGGIHTGLLSVRKIEIGREICILSVVRDIGDALKKAEMHQARNRLAVCDVQMDIFDIVYPQVN